MSREAPEAFGGRLWGSADLREVKFAP